MKAFIIYMPESPLSVGLVNDCLQSIINTKTDLQIELFKAITPKTLDDEWKACFSGNTWKCMWLPAAGEESLVNGMYVHKGHRTTWLERRVSCFLSHYKLWKKSQEINKEILILEHDAHFVRNFSFEKIKRFFTADILSLVDPRFATFIDAEKSIQKIYEEKSSWNESINLGFSLDTHIRNIFFTKQSFCVDIDCLLSNSAYVIKPNVAVKVDKWVMQYNNVIQNDAFLNSLCSVQSIFPYATSISTTCKTLDKRVKNSSVTIEAFDNFNIWE